MLLAAPTAPSLQTARNRDRNSPGASHWRSPGLPDRHRCRGDLAQPRELVYGFENFDLQHPNSAVIKGARFARWSFELVAGSGLKG